MIQKPERYDYNSRDEYETALKQYQINLRKFKMNAIVGGTFATLIGLTALTVIGGSWYTVGEERLQGRAKVIEWLKEDPKRVADLEAKLDV